MKLPEKNELVVLGYCVIILLIVGIVGLMFSSTSARGIFSLLFAVFFYLILPGYFLMLNFNFDDLERIILGMIISSSIIPAILYAINIIGFKITELSVIIIVIFIVAASITYRPE